MSNLTILNSEISTLDNLYSLNDLHKTSGGKDKHQPNRFTRLSQTKELIDEIKQTPDMALPMKTLRGKGIFACKELVYAYAMWISPKFNLQVIRSFDAMQNQPVQNVQPLPQPKPPTLTPAQKQHIKTQVAFLAAKETGMSLPKAFSLIWTRVQNNFQVNTYHEILEKKYLEVCQFLNCEPQPDLIEPDLFDKVEALPSPEKFEAEKYALLNAMIAQMNLPDEPVIVPSIDLMNTVSYMRHIQQRALTLIDASNSIDRCISNLKQATGRSLCDPLH